MQDLSLHILDLVQNSVAAGADFIEIEVSEDTLSDMLIITIKDNGKGMDSIQVSKVTDPFYTTRTTRRVGLGIPLLKAIAESCEGGLYIESKPGEGTEIKASFKKSHIDTPPLGSMEETISALILCNPSIDFVYTHLYDNNKFVLDTIVIKNTLGDVPIENPDVIQWIRSYVKDGLDEIHGGV